MLDKHTCIKHAEVLVLAIEPLKLYRFGGSITIQYNEYASLYW